jgi:Domain of unknown function (DUF4124)
MQQVKNTQKEIAMICRVFLVFLLFTLLLSNISNANVFSWVDEKGNVHFGDHPRVENAKKSTLFQIPHRVKQWLRAYMTKQQ